MKLRSKLSPETCLAALAILCACACEAARGDVLVLNNGGRIEGQLVDGGGADAKADYVIQTPGGRMTITRAQVARVETTSADEKEYEALAKTSPDTVESHWKLYEWSRSHKLREQSQKHLTRILELDPNHTEARTILGFRKQGDDWVNRDELMTARGMVKYQGQYYTRQQVEIMEKQKAAKESHVDWRKDLLMWRAWLNGRREDLAQKAQREIQAIRDPLAAEPVAAVLAKETDPVLQKMWLEVLARLDAPSAVAALVDRSLNDPNEEIRNQSIEYLVASGRRGLIAPYLQVLKSGNDTIINRAATALGQLGDPAAIGPLIDVLVTVRKEKVSDSQGQMSVSQGNGGSGLSMGGGPKYVSRVVHNADVRTALLRLTNIAGFEYDQDAWRAWLAAQAKSHRVDMRRDM